MKKNVIEEKSINDINYELLKKQFPHAVTVDEDGKYMIDPQKLQMSLDPSKAEIKEDGYGLNWVGKKEAYHTAFSKNYKVLKPLNNDENSKNWDETDNILIKGDNLDALKILRQNYFESIKMIYIDPPYNTKSDIFVYNDNFTESTEQTLEELGYEKEYIDYIENIQGAKTHSGWLNFMYPRLLLARDLLKDDGLIFISIDDNELYQLKILCDEIFGEENFVDNIIWKKRYGGGAKEKHLVTLQEYTLVYSKNIEFLKEIFIPLDPSSIKKYYKQKDEKYKMRGGYRTHPLEAGKAMDERKNLIYPITAPDNTEVLPKKQWLWGKERTYKAIENNEIEFIEGKNGWSVHTKQYLKDENGVMRKGKAFSVIDDIYTQHGTNEGIEIFGNAKVFSYPKPSELIKRFLNIGVNDNDIVLDFFAGSGTTAHAVMSLNNTDINKNLKYILVQLPEITLDNSEAQKEGYETIFDITKERIKRVGNKLVEGDIGFRTFEVIEDQKQRIYQKSLEEVSQDDLLAMMKKPDIETNEEILYNLYVAETLPLSTKYKELIKDKLYLASNVAFILGNITSDELVDALKDKKECEYITVYSPNISNDKLTLEIESNISKLGIKPDKLRFRG